MLYVDWLQAGSYQLSLSWVRSIQSMPPHPNSWRSILILSVETVRVGNRFDGVLLTDRKDINRKRFIHMPTIFHMKIGFICLDSQYNFRKLFFFDPSVYFEPQTIPVHVCDLDKVSFFCHCFGDRNWKGTRKSEGIGFELEYICLWFVLMVFVCCAQHLNVKDSTYEGRSSQTGTFEFIK